MRLTLPTYTPIFFFVIPFIRNVLCLLKCLFKHCPQYVSVKPGWPELLPSPQHMQAQAAAKAPMSTAAVDAMRLLLGSSVDKPSHFGQKGNCVTKQLGPAFGSSFLLQSPEGDLPFQLPPPAPAGRRPCAVQLIGFPSVAVEHIGHICLAAPVMTALILCTL